MKQNMYKRITSAAVLIFLAVFSVLTSFLPDKGISRTERRPLAQKPEFSLDTVWDGSYMRQLEEYLKDRFAGREMFRSLKAEFETGILQKSDSGGYYRVDESIYKLETELNEKNVKRAAENFAGIAETYFEDSDVYFSIIPDRNYYVSDALGYPSLDHGRLLTLVQENIGNAAYIPLFDSLNAYDYYRTDLHWRQECITDVAALLMDRMDNRADDGKQGGGSFLDGIKEKTAADNFKGGYAGASAFAVEPEPLKFITNDIIENAVLYDYEKNAYTDVYAWEKLSGTDPYDFFLWGARALLTVENPSAGEDGKRLLLFRDSFGSSIAPLLLFGYREITLVDLRYVSFDYAKEVLPETDYDDVLFLYSETMLNHSDSMKF